MKKKIRLTGLMDSYLEVREPRYSIVFPVLIGLVLLGLVIFFFRSKEDPAQRIADEDPLQNAAPAFEELPRLDPVMIPPPVAGETKTESETKIEPAVAAANSEASLFPDKDFTYWMSPSDLNATIQLLNSGHDRGFWERGHWIKAVEGRWHDGNHEFRIAYEKMPSATAFQWQYRANQTQEQFTRLIDDFSRRGFKLIQSNSFRRPDQTLRFQGVWKKSDASDSGDEELAEPDVSELSQEAKQVAHRQSAPEAVASADSSPAPTQVVAETERSRNPGLVTEPTLLSPPLNPVASESQPSYRPAEAAAPPSQPRMQTLEDVLSYRPE